MAVPDFQTIMLPFLKFAQSQTEISTREIINHLSTHYNLSEEEINERIPSGYQTKLYNRVSWVFTHFKKAGLIENTRRGFCVITDRGLNLLKQNPEKIDLKTLHQFSEFVEFKNLKRIKETAVNPIENAVTEKTPDEILIESYRKIRESLADEIIEKIKSCSPIFFEHLVVDLLVKMGYGGTLQDAGKAVGKSGDGGIDGIIKEDRLGLDIIYLQAKRWEAVVGRPEIQKFAGALQGQRARKGVFITTSDFTKEAREYVSLIDSKIILIDGEELAELMIDYNVGVSNATIYEIKRIDSDYFLEE